MKRYLVEYLDPRNGACSPVDCINVDDDYTAEEYLEDVDANDPELAACYRDGQIQLTEIDLGVIKSRPRKTARSRYMVVGFDPECVIPEGREWVHFFDDLDKAEQYRMDGAVSLGYCCQIYEWTEEDGCGRYEMIYE